MQNPPPPPPPGGMPPMMPPAPAGAMAMPSAYGGFWIRVVAYVIDGVILGVVGFVIDTIFRANPNDPSSAGYTIANLINFIISVGYFVGLWTYWGATVGQRLFKLRIVDANSMQPIGVGKAVLRYIGLIVSFLVCFIGVIWVAFDGRKQGWMDKIAGTVVLQG